MAKVIGVIGTPASGKTSSLVKLPPEKTFDIDCDMKGLSWKGWKRQYNKENKNYIKTDSFSVVLQVLDKIDKSPSAQHIEYVVIDTLNALMVAEEMRIMAMQGGDKRSAWSDLAQNGWQVVDRAQKMRDNITVIILCHSETVSDDNGLVYTRIKTNGRKLEKLVLESKMTAVVLAARKEGKYRFILSADNATCRVPLGAFTVDEIDNDIMLVIKALEDY